MELLSSLFRPRRTGHPGRLRGSGSRKPGQCCGHGSDIMLGVLRRGSQPPVRPGKGEGSRWTTCHSGCAQSDQTTTITNTDPLQGTVLCLKRNSAPRNGEQPETQGRVGVVGPAKRPHGMVPHCPEDSRGCPQLRTLTLGMGWEG